MAHWEEKAKKIKEEWLKEEELCRNLVGNTEDPQYNQCILDPLRFIEANYPKELRTFEPTEQPNINKLLDCEQTKKIVNLIAKKEDPETAFEINFCEGIPKALDDLEKWIGKHIDPLTKKEKKKEFRRIEACLPTESYIIEQEIKKRDGVSSHQKLKSLLVPEEIETHIYPHTVAYTHQFEHNTNPEESESQHLKIDKNLRKTMEIFFNKLNEEKRIKRKD